MNRPKLTRSFFLSIIVLAILYSTAYAIVADYPIIAEKPPSGQSFSLVSLRTDGKIYHFCKGKFDLFGDYQVNMSVPSGVGADKLRLWFKLSATQSIKDAFNHKPMTFLGVGTSNARFCLGREAASKAGGVNNFVNNLYIWVKR